MFLMLLLESGHHNDPTDIDMQNLTADSVRLDDGTLNYVELKAPPIGANYTLTFPTDDGNAGEVLRTDGSGNLTWQAISSTTADIDGVIAGNGLTGTATSGTASLAVGAGTGIVVNADDVAVDVGTTANKIVQLNGSAELPAVSGANLTNLDATDLVIDNDEIRW